MRSQVTRDIRVILDAPDHNKALEALRLTIAKHETTAPKLARWMETAIPVFLTIMQLPPEIRKRLRATNSLGPTNQEFRRRFKTIESFVKEASCLRLASPLLMEISDEWQFGKAY
jgi:transposase-like protein